MKLLLALLFCSVSSLYAQTGSVKSGTLNINKDDLTMGSSPAVTLYRTALKFNYPKVYDPDITLKTPGYDRVKFLKDSVCGKFKKVLNIVNGESKGNLCDENDKNYFLKAGEVGLARIYTGPTGLKGGYKEVDTFAVVYNMPLLLVWSEIEKNGGLKYSPAVTYAKVTDKNTRFGSLGDGAGNNNGFDRLRNALTKPKEGGTYTPSLCPNYLALKLLTQIISPTCTEAGDKCTIKTSCDPGGKLVTLSSKITADHIDLIRVHGAGGTGAYDIYKQDGGGFYCYSPLDIAVPDLTRPVFSKPCTVKDQTVKCKSALGTATFFEAGHKTSIKLISPEEGPKPPKITVFRRNYYGFGDGYDHISCDLRYYEGPSSKSFITINDAGSKYVFMPACSYLIKNPQYKELEVTQIYTNGSGIQVMCKNPEPKKNASDAFTYPSAKSYYDAPVFKSTETGAIDSANKAIQDARVCHEV